MIEDLLVLVTPMTKRSKPRVEYFIDALQRIDAKNLAGDIVECGVWRGASIVLARMVSPKRKCWLYDTFDGMSEPSELDLGADGTPASGSYKRKMIEGRKWAAASREEVEANLRRCDLWEPQKLQFVVGKVEDTLPRGPLPDQIALLHLDTDWYASTAIELELLYPRLLPGGILIVDDYGHWLGARKAVNDYFAGQSVQFDRIDYTGIAVVKT
jgi:O-methyltransferase